MSHGNMMILRYCALNPVMFPWLTLYKFLILDNVIRKLYIYVSKDVRVCVYFSKPKVVRN